MTKGILTYTYDGREYDLGLDEATGKPACIDLGIVADSVEDVKKAIRERAALRKSLPKVNVWVRASRYGYNLNGDRYIRATSNLRLDGRSVTDVWVTREDGRREKVSASSLILSNPENDTLMDEYHRLLDQEDELSRQRGKLWERMTKARALRDDGTLVGREK